MYQLGANDNEKETLIDCTSASAVFFYQIKSFVGILEDEFAFNDYYSAEKLFRDVPEFQPQISLEQGMTQVFEVMEREGRIPDSDALTWEDEIIEKYRRLWK